MIQNKNIVSIPFQKGCPNLSHRFFFKKKKGQGRDTSKGHKFSSGKPSENLTSKKGSLFLFVSLQIPFLKGHKAGVSLPRHKENLPCPF